MARSKSTPLRTALSRLFPAALLRRMARVRIPSEAGQGFRREGGHPFRAEGGHFLRVVGRVAGLLSERAAKRAPMP